VAAEVRRGLLPKLSREAAPVLSFFAVRNATKGR
jgi:hypothetical protein